MSQAFPVSVQELALRDNSPEGTFWDAIAVIRARNPIADKIHCALGLLYLGTIPLAPAPSAITFSILLIFAALRLPHTIGCYRFISRQILIWVLLAWAAWHASSIIWSSSTAQGLDELKAYRVVLTPFMLLPILDRATWLVGAFLTGVAAQNAVQIAQCLGWYPKKMGDGERIRGLIHPIQTGAMCAAAMCWHLCGILRGRSRVFWISAAGFVLAGFGLVASGSRGPWIAAAVALPFGLVLIAWRAPALRLRIVLSLFIFGLAAAAIGPFASDLVAKRFHATVSDLKKVEKGQFRTDVGERLARWDAAWAVFGEAPVQGVGAGGFRDAVKDRKGKLLLYAYHAHSMYMHVLASTGLIGGLLAAAAVLLVLRAAWRYQSASLYTDGFLLVLITWLIGAAFDSYQLNGLLFGLFAFLATATLAMSWRSSSNKIPMLPVGSP